MIYAVSKYQDSISVKKEKEKLLSWQFPRCEYFDTEEEARAFIRKRADEECAKAEKALARAIARTKKCQQKFGFKLGDGREPQHGESK